MRSLAFSALLFASCAADPLSGDRPDLAVSDFDFPAADLPGPPPCVTPNACGDCEPGCMTFQLGPPYGARFPLPSDMPVDPHVTSDRIGADRDGYLRLNISYPPTDIGWIANATDWSRGTVSKFNTQTRETARYFSVTCHSLKGGSTTPCDGMNGCCAADDAPRFEARQAMQPAPGRQQVQLAANHPSRTSLDYSGDLWVENRAPGGQASVTKIVNDPGGCSDRNHNGTIDTSHDSNGDGLIQTDCNLDGQPDDLASIKGKPCANNLPQEFFGLDDECVLITVNIGAPAADGRALALGPGAQDFGPSDPWAGTSSDNTIYRVDGSTGQLKDRVMLPDECHPDGLAVDSSSNVWSSASGPGALCWFSSKKTAEKGAIRPPQTGPISARSIHLDRDQNLWVADVAGAGAFRYAPDRSAGTSKLGAGFWTRITDGGKAAGAVGGGVGIALDSRTNNAYYAWLILDAGWLVRVPASTIALAKMDQQIDGTNYAALRLAGFAPIAIDPIRSQNLAIISRAPSALIQIAVDVNGVMTPPDLLSPPKPMALCPAGARCLLKDNQTSEPGSDAYSDFALWWRIEHGAPNGYYSYVIPGCAAGGTEWRSLAWEADVPLNTRVTLRLRSGMTPSPDLTWGQWTFDFDKSPIQLAGSSQLDPNGTQDASHLQVYVDLATFERNKTPTFKSLQIAWRCIPPI